MILKGNQRGGGQQLATHLMNSFDNERVEVAEVRGAVAQDLSGAFAEWSAEARGTKCQKFLYSLSLNPDQAQGHLTREQYLELLERTERSLKLVGQPRAVVFHEKRDKDGVPREHCHAVWSRIDTEKMKAVQISHDRLKLRTVAQEFALDYGLELPEGMKPGISKDSRTDRFNNRAHQENLGERQQKERTGVGKEELMAEITACWCGAADGPAFVKALEDKGYALARGERHGKPSYVVVDLYGQIHSLSRHLDGVTAKSMRERLQSSHPVALLPGVEDARAAAKQRMNQLQARIEDAHAVPQKSPLDERRQALSDRQAARRSDLDRQRIDLYARQFSQRGALRGMQAADNIDVAAARRERQPKGLAAFLTRITGIGSVVAWAQNKADAKREATHKQQTQSLLNRHDRELKELDRHYRALDRLEKRENRAVSTAVLREGYGKLRARAFDLKPEFDKALKAQEPTGAAGGGNKAVGLFNRLAAGLGFTKGDLQAAFERATTGKARPAGDGDTGGRAPADPEKRAEAIRLRDDLERRQRQQGRDERGPDRER